MKPVSAVDGADCIHWPWERRPWNPRRARCRESLDGEVQLLLPSLCQEPGPWVRVLKKKSSGHDSQATADGRSARDRRRPAGAPRGPASSRIRWRLGRSLKRSRAAPSALQKTMLDQIKSAEARRPSRAFSQGWGALPRGPPRIISPSSLRVSVAMSATSKAGPQILDRPGEEVGIVLGPAFALGGEEFEGALLSPGFDQGPCGSRGLVLASSPAISTFIIMVRGTPPATHFSEGLSRPLAEAR